MSAVLKKMPRNSLDDAVLELVAAKHEEEIAKRRRVAAEERVIALARFDKEEGSQTVEAAGYKVTLTARLIYACDEPAVLAAACRAAGVTDSMIPVKTVIELDATGAKWLRHNEPEYWNAVLSRFVTIKPAKVSVSVKV